MYNIVLLDLRRTENELQHIHETNTPEPEFGDPNYRAKYQAGECTRNALGHIQLAIKSLDPPPVEHCPTCNHIIQEPTS